MPQALASVFIYFGLSLTAASVAAVAVTAALTLGAAYATASLFAPKTARPTRGQEQQAVLNQSVGPRRRFYGRNKLGGTRAFWDSKSGRLYQIVMLAAHLIDAFEEVWLGDIRCDLAVNGLVETAPFYQGPGSSFAQVELHLGEQDQAVSSMISAIFPEWTSAHRLRGIAYIAARFSSVKAEDFSSVWPQSYNTTIRAVIRGAKVWDCRNEAQDPEDDWADPVTWEYEDNSGLCILDFIRHPDGMNKPLSRIEVATFQEFADLCDEDVPLKDGGTEKRYRCWGGYDLTDDPVDTLGRMLATCDGQLYQTAEGKIAIRGGKWTEPTVTIEDNDILMIGELCEGTDAFATFNELKIVYTSPDHDYLGTEAVAWVDTAHQAAHGALVEDFTVDMVPSPSQARRLAKIAMHKRNPKIMGSIVTNLTGLDALGEATITAVIPEVAVNDTFMVTGFALRPDLSGVEIGISALSAAAYAWNPATEEGENPPPPQDTTPDLSLPVPADLTLTIESREITGGSATDVVVATVDDPGRTDLELEAEIRHGAGAWVDMLFDPDAPLEAVGTSTAAAGETYTVRARWKASGGVSSWAPEESITVPTP